MRVDAAAGKRHSVCVYAGIEEPERGGARAPLQEPPAHAVPSGAAPASTQLLTFSVHSIFPSGRETPRSSRTQGQQRKQDRDRALANRKRS